MSVIDKTTVTVGLRLTEKEHERYIARGKGKYLRQFLQEDNLVEEVTKAVLAKIGAGAEPVNKTVDENNTLGAINKMFDM